MFEALAPLLPTARVESEFEGLGRQRFRALVDNEFAITIAMVTIAPSWKPNAFHHGGPCRAGRTHDRA